MSVKRLDLTQGSEEWLAERRKWATASEMAAILGVSGAFTTREKVLKEKISGKAEEVSAFRQNLYDQGHAAEESLREVAAAFLKMPLEPAVYVNSQYGILASIDCINVEEGVIVETKNSTSEKVLSMARLGKAWEPYRIQVLAQMLVTGMRTGFLFVLDGTNGQSYLIPIESDPATEVLIIQAAQAFLKDLREGKLDEVVLEDDRMKRLRSLLNQKNEIETELCESLSTLDLIGKELDALKKMVAFSFPQNTIYGCGVQVTKSKPGTTLDTNKLVAATGMDLTPFMKATAARVTVKLLEVV